MSVPDWGSRIDDMERMWERYRQWQAEHRETVAMLEDATIPQHVKKQRFAAAMAKQDLCALSGARSGHAVRIQAQYLAQQQQAARNWEAVYRGQMLHDYSRSQQAVADNVQDVWLRTIQGEATPLPSWATTSAPRRTLGQGMTRGWTGWPVGRFPGYGRAA